jgi:hypothetical protein
MTMHIGQIREVIALNKGTLPVSVREQILSQRWQDVNERADCREMHGTNTWLTHIAHPSYPASEAVTLPVYVTARIDGSVWVDDHFGNVCGVCASSVSMANDATPPA